MIENICNILLSIAIGILSTGLLVVGISLVLWCISEFLYYIKGCIAEFQYTKYTNLCQLFLDIICTISILGTAILISMYTYFQL